ncbi:MAG: N-acetylglutaminylglutamine synthetase [Bdellovibrionales bacterium]|nr:N-acetylglutaminylglutamine synthetase [Bdellovibrionales bacterium]
MTHSNSTGDIRLNRRSTPTLRNWESPQNVQVSALNSDVSVDCGWGKLYFAHTFGENRDLADSLQSEPPEKRDIAFYVRDPHVLISYAPQELFLDPSNSYRLWIEQYKSAEPHSSNYLVRRVTRPHDLDGISYIAASRKMAPIDPDFIWHNRNSKEVFYLVLEDLQTSQILGFVMGVDHQQIFGDPEHGASLWSLAVDPQAPYPGIGESLTRFLVEYFQARGRAFLDLSVMHDNEQAIALYEKIGFERVPIFCIKRKNPVNEPLYIAPSNEESLNPYAKIITREARLRGVRVKVIDAERALFSLSLGGREVLCRESLTELTSSIAMTICDDKLLTRRVLQRAGLSVPPQQLAGSNADNMSFLEKYKSVVVKPLRGEQGAGVSVGINSRDSLQRAIRRARVVHREVLLEKFIEGLDLRIVVIDYKVVAAAIRKPAQVRGTGEHTLRELIRKQSRRRAANTGGESKIPVDAETIRCIREQGYDLDDTPKRNSVILVRKTANLHTGGTIHDVTDELHPALKEAAQEAALAIKIPVTGLDLIVPSIRKPEYVIIEANERPGLENHQPQPTAQRFIDLLFPETLVSRPD